MRFDVTSGDAGTNRRARGTGLLGRRLGRAVVVAAGAVIALAAGVPALRLLGLTGEELVGSILVWTLALAVATALALGVEHLYGTDPEAAESKKALEEALETIDRQRRFTEAVFDSVDVGLVLLDKDGRYQTMNHRHEEFMRLAFPEGHDGRAGHVGLVYSEDGSAMVSKEAMPTWRAYHGEEFDDCRIWVGNDPLSWRALSVSARTVRDDQGRFTGAALAYTDVTDFMRALRVKDEFVASVSHELRTPLTSIMGYVDLLLEHDDLTREQRTQLNVVSRNGERLSRLVRDLLHTAQADDGPLHMVRTRTDLSAVVRECVRTVTPIADAADVRLQLDAPDELIAMVDEQRIAQAVDNLVSNAIKYTPGGGSVTVCLCRDGSRVEISVADSGIGIESADRDRLFTRFFRSQHAEEQSIQGVGLGLSITKSIVESHGGRIEVESEVDHGSVFRIRLPGDNDVAAGPPGIE
ncbi:MAG: ATP-binding protein [Nocardioides sp.]